MRKVRVKCRQRGLERCVREDALEWQALSSIAGESLEPLRVGSEEVQCKSTAREEWGASAALAGEGRI